MRIVITGAGGQLGRGLADRLSPSHDLTLLTRADLNVADRHEVIGRIERCRPDAIIHAAAYTNVDAAEREREQAYAVNALGAKHVAEAAKRIGAKLVYVSTDYVFNGCKGAAYEEQDAAVPVNYYGYTKLEGERYVRELHERHFIVRTAWLFGAGGHNFVKTMVSLARRQPFVRAATDAVGSPTYTSDLADFLGELVETEQYGVYHAVNAGECSRYEFACAIVASAGIRCQVLPAGAGDFELPARRPAHSALAQTAIRQRGFAPLRDWRSALEEYLRTDPYFQTEGESAS